MKDIIELQITDAVFKCGVEITKAFIVGVLPLDEDTIFKYKVVKDISIPESEAIVSFEKNIENIVTFEGKEYNVENDDELVCLIRNIKAKLSK